MDCPSPTLRPPPLKLRTSPKELEASQCTRCYELHTTEQPCRQRQRIPRSPASVPSSDFSSYTARICPSTSSLPKSPLSPSSGSIHSDGASLSSTGSSPAPSIKVRLSRKALPRAPALRRKISPTQTSLRDIRASQQLQMQTKQSEDQLRELYERQTMEYLVGDFASLDGLQG